MIVNRTDLLEKLSRLLSGVDPKAISIQSDCFTFSDGKVWSFNEQILCSCDSPLDGFKGAIPADPLIKLLKQLPDKELDIIPEYEGLKIKQVEKSASRRRMAKVAVESDLWLDTDLLDKPEEWINVPANFEEAITLASSCTMKTGPKTTGFCVNIAPGYIEACDNVQLCRYSINSGFSENILIEGNSIKRLVGLGLVQYSLTSSWLHFRSADGLTVSCRRFKGKFPNLTEILVSEGVDTKLPSTLSEAIKNCSIFNNEVVVVKLKSNKVLIESFGNNGFYREQQEAEYDGYQIKFRVPLKLLNKIVNQKVVCKTTPGKILIDGGVFTYATCTQPVEEDD